MKIIAICHSKCRIPGQNRSHSPAPLEKELLTQLQSQVPLCSASLASALLFVIHNPSQSFTCWIFEVLQLVSNFLSRGTVARNKRKDKPNLNFLGRIV